MSAETFVNALFLITAVVAAGILITAVLPIIWNMAGTFSTASHESDTRMRTDFKIVTTYASGATDVGKVWIKNIGTQRIGVSELQLADIFFGPQESFGRLTRQDPNPDIGTDPNQGYWSFYIVSGNSDTYWDPGETLEIHAYSSNDFASGNYVYFQFVLPNGVWRSSEFTASG